MSEKEHVNHPDHYNQYSIETIDMMIAIWGKDAVATHCEITAFKYRMRLGHKDSKEQELKKEQWYLSKAKELRASLENSGHISLTPNSSITVSYCDQHTPHSQQGISLTKTNR